MKQQEIRNIYTQKVTELLNQGYTIFPDTMNGSQGEIAHIDLTDGNEIVRVLLNRDYRYHGEGGYWGDTIRLTVGKAGRDTWVGNRWDGTIWNQYLEPRFEIEWADLSRGRGNWYTSLEEGRRAQEIQHARYGNRPEAYASEELGAAYKSAALRWVKRQPRMKTCRLEDITAMRRIRRVSHDGKYERYFEIEARGQKLTLGR